MKKSDIKNKKKAADAVVKSTRGEVYEWIQCLAFALIFCVIVFVFFFRLVDVVGDSMNPTLENADKMLVSDLFYKPKQGDIVIFRKDEYKSEALVKRVIATEGQTVEIDFNKGRVYVDGVLLDEPYIAEPTINQIDFTGVQVVPEGCVFVMGDNRNESTDSRDSRIGMVDERLIIGKVLFTVFPLDHIGSPYGD
ncbi:MAG: signal peptidase I [Oscillospiraceae bacterium]|nr:signal peptidase I [Oscillospiraceae bacterium]